MITWRQHPHFLFEEGTVNGRVIYRLGKACDGLFRTRDLRTRRLEFHGHTAESVKRQIFDYWRTKA